MIEPHQVKLFEESLTMRTLRCVAGQRQIRQSLWSKLFKALGSVSISAIFLGLAHPAASLAQSISQNSSTSTTASIVEFMQFTRPETDLLEPNAILPGSAIVTSYNVSQAGMSIPSLWWMQEQFGGKLLDLWLAYPGGDGEPRRVELVVNSQIWSIYNYLERYTFLNHFGVAAQEYGYSTRVVNRDGEILATYICDFSSPLSDTQGRCAASVGFGGLSGIRGDSAGSTTTSF